MLPLQWVEGWGTGRWRAGWTYFPLSSTQKSRLTVQDMVPMYFSCRCWNGGEIKRKNSRIIPLKKGNVRFLTVGWRDWTLQWWRKIMESWFKNSQTAGGTAALWSSWNRSSAWVPWGDPGWAKSEEFNLSQFRVWFLLPKNKACARRLAPPQSPAQLPVPVTTGGSPQSGPTNGTPALWRVKGQHHLVWGGVLLGIWILIFLYCFLK